MGSHRDKSRLLRRGIAVAESGRDTVIAHVIERNLPDVEGRSTCPRDGEGDGLAPVAESRYPSTNLPAARAESMA